MNFSLSSTADSSQFANLRIYNYDEDDSAWEDDQAWMIVPDSTGTYFSILSKADPNLAITAYGSAGEDAPGTTATSEGNVFVTEFTGANNQLWTIESGDRAVGCGNSIKSGGTYDELEGSTDLSFVCPVTNYGDTVAWSSNNTYSTTVNQNGKVTCLKAGRSVITVTVTHTDGNTTQYTATVHVIIENGVYYMLNKKTGYRLEYEDPNDYSEGAVMEVYDYREDGLDDIYNHALFKIKHLGEGLYSIRSMLRNDMGWTYTGDASDLVMTNIGTADSEIPDEAKWYIMCNDNGYSIYYNLMTKTITAPEDSGENIYFYRYIDTDLTQHWELTRVTTSMNDVVIYDKVSVLLVDESATFSAAVYSSYINQNGQNGFTWSITSGSEFASIDSSTGVLTAIAPGSVTVKATYKSYTWNDTWSVVIVPIPDGTYFFRNVEFDDKYMQINQNVSPDTDGAHMEIFEFNSEVDQRWNVTHVGSGYYKIVSEASGYALTAPTDNDQSITQTTYSSYNSAQKWIITKLEDGTYKISPLSDTSSYMAVSEGAWSSGRNVEKRANQSDGLDEWTLHRMLPLSGYELEYNSSLWSGDVENFCNCYAYAINNQLTPNGFLWPKQQPGEYANIELNQSDFDEDGEEVKTAVEKDFKDYGEKNNQQMIFSDIGRYESCPQGTYKVALVIAPNDDFHWYRQDSDGVWSHKLGTTPVTRTDDSGNLIFDPQTADRGKYTAFIGYFKVTPWSNYYSSVSATSLDTLELNDSNISNGAISFEAMENITIGMTYDDVISILGGPGIDIGCGAILYQYELCDGQIIVLNYCQDACGELILCNVIYQ